MFPALLYSLAGHMHMVQPRPHKTLAYTCDAMHTQLQRKNSPNVGTSPMNTLLNALATLHRQIYSHETWIMLQLMHGAWCALIEINLFYNNLPQISVFYDKLYIFFTNLGNLYGRIVRVRHRYQCTRNLAVYFHMNYTSLLSTLSGGRYFRSTCTGRPRCMPGGAC